MWWGNFLKKYQRLSSGIYITIIERRTKMNYLNSQGLNLDPQPHNQEN